MRTRLAPFCVVALLILVAFALAGCERDRPAPASGTPGVLLPLGTAGPGTPSAVATGQGLGQGLATPIPLQAVTATPALLRPAATVEPATASGASQPSAGQTAGGTYTVQRGDNLGSIAAKYGVSTKDILAINPSITNPDVLAVGQQIKLPSGPSVSAPASSGSSTSTGASTSGGAGEVYVVKKGDILGSIARRYGVTLAALMAANNISNADKIFVGQKLTIPAGGSTAPATTGQGRSYTVQRGDTMSTIAVKFGVTVAQLQAANGITNPNKITVGQVLKIP